MRVEVKLIALLLLSAALAVGQTGEVRGLVVDATSAPVLAKIELISVDRKGPLLRTDADYEGRFQFRGVPTGWYLLRAAAKGFAETRRDIEVREGAVADAGIVTLRVACYYSISCGPPPAPPAKAVRVRGRIVDQSGNPIGDPKWPTVVVFWAAGSVEPRLRAEIHDPEFEVAVAPDEYKIRVAITGFEWAEIQNVVAVGRELDLGIITMRLPGPECDVPGPVCAAPPPDEIIAASEGTLWRGCGLDLTKKDPRCEQASLKSDLTLEVGGDGAAFLAPQNGARISACDSPQPVIERVRIDRSHWGEDWCVRTHDGHNSRVFIKMDEVPSNAVKVAIWFVTRR
jgi:hypothetical protein